MVMVSSGAPLLGDTLLMLGGDDGAGGAIVVPHPPVLMLSALPLYVMLTAFAAVQAMPLTVTVCALHTLANRPTDAISVASSRILK